MTESEISKAFGTEYVAWARLCLARIGVTVVPDPEPTNAEKLAALMYEADEKDHSSVPGGWEHVAEFLDRAGVIAPGGEGDE